MSGRPRGYGSRVLTPSQRDAVRAAFDAAGYDGPLTTAPVTSDEERIFLIASAHPGRLRLIPPRLLVPRAVPCR